MSHRKKHKRPLTNWQKASALVPLALLSAGWTTSLAATGTSASADTRHPELPNGSALPSGPVKTPASVSLPGEIAPGVPTGSAGDVIASASTNGIPSVALSAYQRAAQVIDAADKGCNIDWTLIAAIGRVESDHGRFGGNTLGQDGISRPGIYGIPLDGTHGTALVRDTDGGQYDNDPIYDRAVGPMQFIPATWSVVGVDGDGDGKRNPQDINDAALATAVYLCSGNEDLSTTAGQTSAVLRYNHSQQYVDLVLSIAAAYAGGNYTSVPDSAAAPITFVPWSSGSTGSPGDHATRHPRHAGHSAGSGSSSGSKGSGSGSSSGSGGTTPTAPTSPAPTPSTNPTNTVSQVTKPVADTISAGSEAVSFCSANLPDLSPLSPADKQTVINDCAAKIVGMTKAQAADAIPNTLSGVLSWLGLTSMLSGLGGSGGLLGN